MKTERKNANNDKLQNNETTNSGKDNPEKDKIAVVRVRGLWGIKPKIKTTLEKLRLHKVNHCVILNARPEFIGMLKICKDYVAYGPISEEMLIKLISKRGRKRGNKKLSANEIKEAVRIVMENEKLDKINVKPVFRLRPPRRGYKSIKHAYPKGALGRWPCIDELISRMI